MARVSQEVLEQAVVDTIAEMGPDVEYSALTDALTASGNGAAVPLLRGMKHRGVISLRLERQGDAIVHYASVPAATVEA